MKNINQLLREVKELTKKNAALQQQLLNATQRTASLKSLNIDALVVSHKKAVKIYTDPSADKTYRVLIEKMQQGAVTLSKDGLVLYCNSYFANMLGTPLEKVIGIKFVNFMDDTSKKSFAVLLNQGWKGYAQDEVNLLVAPGKTIPVLISANTMSLNNKLVLSFMLTDLSVQKKRLEFKTVLVERIIQVITEMNITQELIAVNNSDYISQKLNYDYTYLSNIFSEAKGTTIGQFIIVNKIEKVKELLLYGEFNLTEIAYNLQYSSVAHLSHQFKKITGFSPTGYIQKKQNKKAAMAGIKNN